MWRGKEAECGPREGLGKHTLEPVMTFSIGDLSINSLHAAISAGVLFFSVITCCVAGDAAFSSNGKRIYAIASNDPNPALQEIDLATKTIRTIALTQLATNDWPRGITRSNDDKIFCATNGSLWSFDPRSESLTKSAA